jgi:hypothetical protein
LNAGVSGPSGSGLCRRRKLLRGNRWFFSATRNPASSSIRSTSPPLPTPAAASPLPWKIRPNAHRWWSSSWARRIGPSSRSVVDQLEPPPPSKVTGDQGLHFGESLARGEPHRADPGIGEKWRTREYRPPAERRFRAQRRGKPRKDSAPEAG